MQPPRSAAIVMFEQKLCTPAELPGSALVSSAAPAALGTTIISTPATCLHRVELPSALAGPTDTHLPSIIVFRAHLARQRLPDGSEVLDAEGVVSKACYEDWLNTRGSTGAGMETPERVFQRTLTGCLTAADGRRPFDEEEEAAILKTIRQKRIWYITLSRREYLRASRQARVQGN